MTVQLVNSQVVVQPSSQQVVVQVVQGLQGRSLNNQGDWATATSYAILDFFRDPATNKLYSVLVAHTSTSVAADLAALKLSEMLNITQIETLRNETVTKAGEALASANASEVSRLASGVSASASEVSRLASGVSAVASEESKVISVAQADIATDQAVIAEAQALIATNKAADAAASAASIDPATLVPIQIHAATAKTTPVDADEFGIADSAATFGLKRLTWASIKATLLGTWKDTSGGLAGLTLFKINFRNTANTFTSFFVNANTASRTYTGQDRDGIIADDTDLAGKVSRTSPTGSALIPSGTTAERDGAPSFGATRANSTTTQMEWWNNTIWAAMGGDSAINDIGTPGAQGFGVGICPTPPPGFAELSGTRDKASDNYGNYLYQDGSVMVWVPLFYYRIAHASNPTYATYLLNSIDIKPESYFADVTAANAVGYALHRAFRDGGATKRGVFVDKYGCSNNAGVASSMRYGKPLSTAADHNPINALNGAPSLTYAGVIDAAKTRGAKFFCCSTFIRSALALLSVAHGQASAATTYCAWYNATYNFPKGCNNNALGDTNDAGVLFLSDGYSNCGKAGSGAPFAKTTHNGQSCGVADINGNMWEITLGLTRPGTTATEAINDALGTTKFHILKESVAMSTLTSGWNTGNDHWGTDAFLDTNFQEINLAHVGAADGWQYFGNGTNQVFSADLSGNNWLMTGLGIYKDANGASASGTNLFGQDGLYEYHISNLCVLSGGGWTDGGVAGVCCAYLNAARSPSYSSVGFRAACYCD